eukprot:3713993-Rhodomonas_salina.2
MPKAVNSIAHVGTKLRAAFIDTAHSLTIASICIAPSTLPGGTWPGYPGTPGYPGRVHAYLGSTKARH